MPPKRATLMPLGDSVASASILDVQVNFTSSLVSELGSPQIPFLYPDLILAYSYGR